MRRLHLGEDARAILARQGLELRWSPFSLKLALVPGYGAGFALTLTADSGGWTPVPLRYDTDFTPLPGASDVGPADRVIELASQQSVDADRWLSKLLQGTFGSSNLDSAAPVIAACASAPLSAALHRPATVMPAAPANQFTVTLAHATPVRLARPRARTSGVWL